MGQTTDVVANSMGQVRKDARIRLEGFWVGGLHGGKGARAG